MAVYCTHEFKTQVEKLGKNASYQLLEADLVAQYCNKPFAEACSGRPLSLTPGAMFLKKRLDGSGGFRVYFMAYVKDEDIYLIYVHPKTGRDGIANISPEDKKAALAQLVEAKRTQNLFCVSAAPGGKAKALFTHAVTIPPVLPGLAV